MLVSLVPFSRSLSSGSVIWFDLKSEFVDRKRNLRKFRFAIASLAARWLHRWLNVGCTLAAPFELSCLENNCGRWLVEACYTFISKSQL